MSLSRRVATLLLAAVAPIAFAAPGDIDYTFDQDGFVTTPLNRDVILRRVAQRADGGLVAVGRSVDDAGNFHGIVARYRADGSADGVDDPVFPTHSEALAVAPLPDGAYIVVGGSSFTSRVAKYLANGSRDTSFGTNGTVELRKGTGVEIAWAVAVQPDGRILVAIAASGPQPGWALARLMPDGTLDASFGAGGYSDVFAGRTTDRPEIRVLPDGRILFAGAEQVASRGYETDLYIYRLLGDGSVDATFGTAGRVSRNVRFVLPAQIGLEVLPDGHLLLATNSPTFAQDSNVYAVQVERFLSDGALDTTFGDGGTTVFRNMQFDRHDLTGMAVTPGGKIWLVASVGDFRNPRIQLVRLTPGGQLDSTFSDDGQQLVFLTDMEGADLTSLLRQRDGRLVIGADFKGTQFLLIRIDGGYATQARITRRPVSVPAGAPARISAEVYGGENFTGTFEFRDGDRAIAGCEAVPITNGYHGECDATFTRPGTHTITAVYSGDEMFLGSTSPPEQTEVTASGDPNADDDGDGVPNGIEPGEGLDPLVKDNDVFARPRLFAMQQYRDFLGREGDAGGIDYWAQQIDRGAATRTQVIESFVGSGEFQNGLPQCSRLYFSFFLRIPDYAGLMFQVGQYRAGVPLEAISQNFSSSPEFTNRYGSLTNEQYVDLVYQNVLGRAPDAEGRQYYLDRLNDGRLTRGQMMIGFSESPEFQQIIENEVYVTAVYVGMLRRAPDQAGMDFYVDGIENGQPRDTIISNFLGSAEYRARFLP